MKPAAAPSAIANQRRVLVVDDEASMRMALELSFAQRGWQVDSAAGKIEALGQLRQRTYPLVVTDVRMPDGDGIEVLRQVREMAPETSVILLTAFAAVTEAVSAIKLGACEYLAKPVAFEQLLDAAERLLSRRGQHVPAGERAIVGSSAALLRSLEQARHAAECDADILIAAESGTGKELLARMIHAHSPRRERPFVAVNCAAMPEALLESELFGHARGAFTGAIAAQQGKFEAATRGTLLLDEIGELPLNLQPKLLRVLQEREFYRLGENRSVRLDARIIATTNRQLSAMVKEGSFRADLYYRLNVIPLTLPPLRQRREDIRELALHFAAMFTPAGAVPEIPESFLGQLEQHCWPGNIRELANVMRRAVALNSTELAEARPKQDGNATERVQSSAPCGSMLAAEKITAIALTPGTSLESAERRLVELTLEATSGNRSRAAQMLGISLRTVRNKIREYKLPARREYVRTHNSVEHD